MNKQLKFGKSLLETNSENEERRFKEMENSFLPQIINNFVSNNRHKIKTLVETNITNYASLKRPMNQKESNDFHKNKIKLEPLKKRRITNLQPISDQRIKLKN